jgi:hypothetical protein
VYKIVKQFRITNDAANEDDATGEDDDTNKEIIKLNTSISTRALIGGHSNFTSEVMSTDEMFADNNKRADCNLDQVPLEIQNNTCLVFNINHPENFIVKRNPTLYRNMLIAAYSFRPSDATTRLWTNYLTALNSDSECESFINSMAANAVITIPLDSIAGQFEMFGVRLSLPRRLDIDPADVLPIDPARIGTPDFWINLTTKYPNLGELFGNDSPVGLMVRTNTGYRHTIMIPTYWHLFNLRGNFAVYKNVDTPKNTINLFRLFWHLLKMSHFNERDFMKEYLEHFDDAETHFFSTVFGKFHAHFMTLITRTQNVYYMAFIGHKMDRKDIPYSLKPICGELHKIFQQTKQPTTLDTVRAFYMTQPAGKVFWRLFSAM